MKTDRKNRRIDEKRTMSTMIIDAERRLKRGLLTYSEYSEIYEDFESIYNFKEVETISKKVADFFKGVGGHVIEAGIGEKVLWDEGGGVRDGNNKQIQD